MNKENVWLSYNDAELKELHEINEEYKEFLSASKTERLVVKNTIALAEKAGYVNLEDCIRKGTPLKAGDKVYAAGMKKTIALFCLGKKPLSQGMNILGAHIDSPRMDLKQNPLYEDTDFAYLDTHYYGGIKKYQWVTIPLALYGVVAKKDGSVVEIAIGDQPEDPVFCITDLLIHLSADQMQKNASAVIEGEALDVMVGSKPLKGVEKEGVKAAVLKLLKEKYDMEEDDFLSAEIEVVPAGKARDMGFDRSMVAAYGQDDKVCAYTSLVAFLETEKPERTAVCLLTDKEEVGSEGATGAQSMFFENTVAEILSLMGDESLVSFKRAMQNSYMLSTDVSAAFDPSYPSVSEKKNTAYFGHGISIAKYTGVKGKVRSNDANAEYMAMIRRIFDGAGVRFQTAELGKVDVGGGGTIAYISAAYGMNVIDAGVPVLSMHAPMEICSKADIYEAVKAYKAFLKEG